MKNKHTIMDVYGVDKKLICKKKYIKDVILELVRMSNSVLIKMLIHSFKENNGITAVALLKESHISIHTWPEYQILAADFFICSLHENSALIDYISNFFDASHVCVKEVERINAY